MITTEAQLQQALEQIARMHRALAALRQEVLPVNPRQFALLAEAPTEQIKELEAAVQGYSGRPVESSKC